jgi:purine-nucleoside phosphorylase
MTDTYNKLKNLVDTIRKITDFKPDIAVVLGSGLGNFADNLEVSCIIPYTDIDGFPISTAPGHKGQFVFGTLNGKAIVAMQGRFHYYEGYSIDRVVLPIRLMRMLGAKTLILTNAAGGINTDFAAGSLMLITDQICLVPSPLIGQNVAELGERFADMSNIYDDALQKKAIEVAKKLGIPLEKGVYIQTTGPNYESKAEIRMYRTCGADAVGMSTAVEAIAAAHCGYKTIGISCISNMACGVSEIPPNEQEVLEVAGRVGPMFNRLIDGIIAAI